MPRLTGARMADRQAQIAGFLARVGWGNASQAPLAGDASARRYLRLRQGDACAVLMDADPHLGERVDRFLQVGLWLRDHGYSAPRVLAEDAGAGFLLLEDLGDDLVARMVARDRGQEMPLYLAVTGFLSDLHRQTPPAFLAVADGPVLADLSARISDWYLPAVDAHPTAATAAIAGHIVALHQTLSDGRRVVSLRDFHAENLIWLPDRLGPAQAGLLDFQDAFVTDPAYDLVSLCQDARRDVLPETEAACIHAYVRLNGLDQGRFTALYALLGVQRALRIIAVFARLCLRSGKPQYLAHMPRVWGHLNRNLAHSALAGLARAVADGLPRPTPDLIERIREKCGTRPDL